MSDQSLKVQCPLCEGRSELRPSEILELFSNPEMRNRLDARISEIAEYCSPFGSALKIPAINFQREVHKWNPTLPIWRRSPKE